MSGPEKMFRNAEKIAAGVLKCECGNEDWRQFLFVGSDDEPNIAGCKKCGRVYQYDINGGWLKKADPTNGLK